MEFFFSLNKVKVDKDTAKPLENIEIVDVKIVKEDELDEKTKMDAKLDEMITDVSSLVVYLCVVYIGFLEVIILT